MDYAGLIKGKSILAIVVAYSKYIDAYVVSSSSSETERILRRTFTTHGSSHLTVSYNRSSFTSWKFSKFYALNVIEHHLDVHHITLTRMDWLSTQCKPFWMDLKSSRQSGNVIIELCSSIPYTGWNDKFVVLKKTTLQLYLKNCIEKISSVNLIM